jgi:predicted MFS family arabinose efflux permease
VRWRPWSRRRGRAFYLYLYEGLRLSPRVAGTALAIGNLGILFGVAVGRRLARTTRPAGIRALAFAGPSAFWILPLSPSGGTALLFVAAYQLVFFFGGYGFFIYHTTLRQQVTAEGQQARAFSVISTVGMGTAPLGALAGGLLNSELSYRATITIGAAIATAGATLAFGLPSLAAARQPTGSQEHTESKTAKTTKNTPDHSPVVPATS